jgi:hypothetical protein
MGDGAALRIAINLVHLPSLLRKIRSGPLPEGVLLLLRIASGDRNAENEAVALTSRTVVEIRQAAIFFIEQVLLHPDADSYNVLGANPRATNEELRRNMALLLKWLHPDLNRQTERSLHAQRVTMAWNDLKTPVRRSAYDERLSTREKGSIFRYNTVRTGYNPAQMPQGLLVDDARRGRVGAASGWRRAALLFRALQLCFNGRKCC